jgi:hypothetical protein
MLVCSGFFFLLRTRSPPLPPPPLPICPRGLRRRLGLRLLALLPLAVSSNREAAGERGAGVGGVGVRRGGEHAIGLHAGGFGRQGAEQRSLLVAAAIGVVFIFKIIFIIIIIIDVTLPGKQLWYASVLLRVESPKTLQSFESCVLTSLARCRPGVVMVSMTMMKMKMMRR